MKNVVLWKLNHIDEEKFSQFTHIKLQCEVRKKTSNEKSIKIHNFLIFLVVKIFRKTPLRNEMILHFEILFSENDRCCCDCLFMIFSSL
jgi:hypothetical protein